MYKVLIVVEATGEGIANSPTTERMVSALKSAIAQSACDFPLATSIPTSMNSGGNDQPGTLVTVSVVGVNNGGVDCERGDNSPQLLERIMSHSDKTWAQNWESKNVLICPLTLNLPVTLPFLRVEAVYQACRDVSELRQRVGQQLGCAIADGCFWLPVVLTAKGPLYGEVIGLAGKAVAAQLPEDLSSCNLSYYQPFHLSDARRQRIYHMGHQVLQLLSAPPATYLVQFGFQDTDICFDRLWPFPAAPAVASLGIQQPDLFACHWHCLTSLPILDLMIIPPVEHRTSS